MRGFEKKLKGLSLRDECFTLSVVLICIRNYLLNDKKGKVQYFNDNSFIFIYLDKVKYFEMIDGVICKTSEFDIEDFIYIICDKSRAIIDRISEELGYLTEIDDTEGTADAIRIDMYKSILEHNLNKLEMEYKKE